MNLDKPNIKEVDIYSILTLGYIKGFDLTLL